MKRLFILMLLTSLLQVSIQAQEVYFTIRKNAQTAVDNPATIPMLKQVNQFKIDALDYMIIKMKEEMPDSSVYYLDKEAYALHNFMTLYMQTIIECQKEPDAYQVQIIKLFMDASYSNPLFNDDDKELTLAYYADGKSLTRFSLDTDWRLAYIAVATELKKMKKQ